MSLPRLLKPGSTIGMLGGGQLGRMAALAAAHLGYHMHVFAQDAAEPAVEVCRAATIAPWSDERALTQFAAAVDAITLEFENVPLQAATLLAGLKPLFPGVASLAVAQDRIQEKTFLAATGVSTVTWAKVETGHDLEHAAAAVPFPAILKTARMGYDGRGQIRIADAQVAETAWASLGRVPCILEAMIDFDCEVSAVLARGQDGTVAVYPVVENRHENGILAETIAPARIDLRLSQQAERIAVNLAEALTYTGVLAVEFFVCGDRLLVNEIAPRPHNSGHWTIDACHVSQFEQQIRAVAGLPLGPTARHSNATMINLIGEAALEWQAPIADPGAHLHLYGKQEMRLGRKMGHVTRLSRLQG